jgi:PRTase ComF-like
MLSALHTIGTYPFDLGNPIFAHYTAMKFGHFESVSYFAELLTPMALEAFAAMPNKDQRRLLTSPPLQGLPCGANLVCRALCGRLAKALPDGQAPRLDSMDVRGARIPFRNAADFENYDNYSKYDMKQRRKFYLPRRERATYDLASFEGRHTVFVNDINVTGTQLATITKLLQRAGVKRLDVLLIVNVDPKIGCAFPQLENEINTSSITDLAELTVFLRDGEFEPTAKLIARLMSYDLHEFGAIFEALRPPQRQMLHRAILQEGLYGGPLFKEKIRTVERAVFGERADDLVGVGGSRDADVAFRSCA